MEEPRLPALLNADTFPAKLWRLVNSPRFQSVRWDARGEGLVIEQPLCERELLGAGTGCATGPAGGGAAGAAGFFKTKNFASFIRQLNLYGFRKGVMGPAGSVAGPEPGPQGGNGGYAGPLHHFHSPHFRRDRPDLLVRMKRLTSANKAKLAAGLEVSSRPPNRFQRLLGTWLHGDLQLPPSTLGKAKRPGPQTVGGFQPRRCFFPYSHTPTSSQNQGPSPPERLAGPPVPCRTWQSSLGVLPGHQAPPAFPQKGVAFPGLVRCVTEVTYTHQLVFSLLPLQRGSQTAAASRPNCSVHAPPTQYAQACYPTATLPCPAPAHVDPRTGCADPAASTSPPCSFVPSAPVQAPYAAKFSPSHSPRKTSDEDQRTEVNVEDLCRLFEELHLSAPVQAPYAAEFPASNSPCKASDESRMAEVSLEELCRLFEELHFTPEAELMEGEPVESQHSAPPSNRGQPLLVPSGNLHLQNPASSSKLLF